MKKLVSLLLLLTMVCLVPCAVALDRAEYVGTWYLNGTYINDEEVYLGISMTLELREDGTGELTSSIAADATLVTWTTDENGLTLHHEGSEEVMLFTDREDGIYSQAQGLLFGKEKKEADIFSPGEAVAAAALSDFDGLWRGDQYDMGGLMLPLAVADMSQTLEISDSKMTMVASIGEQTATTEYTCELINGRLLCKSAAGEMELTLYDSGCVSYATAENGVTVTVYFLRAE